MNRESHLFRQPHHPNQCQSQSSIKIHSLYTILLSDYYFPHCVLCSNSNIKSKTQSCQHLTIWWKFLCFYLEVVTVNGGKNGKLRVEMAFLKHPQPQECSSTFQLTVIHSSIHPFSRYSLHTWYVPGPVVGPRKRAMDARDNRKRLPVLGTTLFQVQC